jgi:hypothetical protein
MYRIVIVYPINKYKLYDKLRIEFLKIMVSKILSVTISNKNSKVPINKIKI